MPPPTALAAANEIAVISGGSDAWFRAAAARGVGDPVVGATCDGVYNLVADYQGADIAARLVDIVLDVKDAMHVAAQRLFVLQDSLGRIPVVDLGQEPPPRAGEGLEHHGVAHLLDGVQGRFRREGNPCPRYGDARIF